MNSGAAHVLRGLSLCGKPVILAALRQQEAALIIQRTWKSGRREPPARKKRRVERLSDSHHWFWGAVWSLGRPGRAAAASLLLDELRGCADISVHIRFIRIWARFESSEHPIEWAAVLQEVISMLPEDDVLAVCKNFLWSRVCRMAASASDSNTGAAYASLITNLCLQSASEEKKKDAVLRNKELLWKDEDAYADLIRAWDSFPVLFGPPIDPGTACYVPQRQTPQEGEADESGIRNKPPQEEEMCDNILRRNAPQESEAFDIIRPIESHQQGCCTDDEEEVMIPPINEEENDMEENGHAEPEDDGDESCGEDHDDEDEDDHDIDDVSSGASDDEMIVDDIHEITMRGSEANVAEHTTDDEMKKERHSFIIRSSMKVIEELSNDVLLKELLDIIKPPAKPSQTKILLRRAPSQEEYFRGSISQNPLDIDFLEGSDPTVEDLRQFIAKELQMADSSELIEILVSNQILSPGLKLRVVNQILWKQFLIDGNGSGAVFSSGSISILWTTNRRVTSTTPLSALPPMVATYRLIGVDGEATEDTVETLEDPEKEREGPTDEELENIRLVDPLAVFRCTDMALEKLLIQIQRDRVDNGPACGDVIPPSLAIFKHCCNVHAERFVLEGAPTAFLQHLLRLFQVLKQCCVVTDMLQSLIEHLTTNISLAAENVEKQREQLSTLLETIDKLDLPGDLCERVANLLPFLTYGQPSLSRELAQHIDRNIKVDVLGQIEETTLTKTLVQMIIHLPKNTSCDMLRTGLLDCGLGRRLSRKLLLGLPKSPPSWTSALWKKKANSSAAIIDSWKRYYDSAPTVSLLLKLMNGLGQIGASSELVKALHWLEATSDSSEVNTQDLGLLSETLLDNLIQVSDPSKQKIAQFRKATRERKKEIASEKRSRALAKMKLGSSGNSMLSSNSAPKKGSLKKSAKASSPAVPDWMTEADQMVEESGLTCAVCQEGRSLQPKELLGLYAFVSKVTLVNDKCGSKDAISGIQLLKRLPSSLPSSLHGSVLVEDWYSTAKATASELNLRSSSRRTTMYTTSVSAGTGIHLSCHRRARAVDRNHPKAPKSEWSGAALRNNRVSCNIIIPLISSRSSSLLPIGIAETALADYHSCVANSLGAMPPSMLWSSLYDVYFLLLRIAYNEDLSNDCGGGSLASNCELIFYQFIAADTFDRDAQAENMAHSAHARCLPSGLLTALSLINEDGSSYNPLATFAGDAAIMSVICSVVFHNCTESSDSQLRPFPKRQWALGRDFFLRALLITAGRRHFMGLKGSGCTTEGSGRAYNEEYQSSYQSSSGRMSVDVIAPFVHPMLVLFGVMDHVSADFSPAMKDEEIRDSTQRLVTLLTDCRRIRSIPDLTRRLGISCRDDDIVAYFQKGSRMKSSSPPDM